MLCLKQFPTDVKAQMKAKAALERKSLRDWLVDAAKRALAQTMREGRKR
jgi:hypothetical protein